MITKHVQNLSKVERFAIEDKEPLYSGKKEIYKITRDEGFTCEDYKLKVSVGE